MHVRTPKVNEQLKFEKHQAVSSVFDHCKNQFSFS